MKNENPKDESTRATGSVQAQTHRVLPLELELVDGQSLGVLQLLDLLHLLVVAADLLVDDHLHAPGEGRAESS